MMEFLQKSELKYNDSRDIKLILADESLQNIKVSTLKTLDEYFGPGNLGTDLSKYN